MTTPTVVDSVDLHHQTGSITPTAFSIPSAGLYTVKGYLGIVSGASNDNTLDLTINWNDGEANQGAGPVGLAGYNLRAGSGGGYATIDQVIYFDGDYITYQLTSSGTGSPEYNLHLRVIAYQ